MLSHLNDTRLFLLSSVPAKDYQQFNSAKLATYNKVLRSCISFREDCVKSSKDIKLTRCEAANQTVHELKNNMKWLTYQLWPHTLCVSELSSLMQSFSVLEKYP